jgi:TonB-linked SusC/RagA family outer membrane protein
MFLKVKHIDLFVFSILFIIAILNPEILFSQTSRVVKGTVTEEGTKEALIGVTVVEINNDNRVLNGVITDVNGGFTLKISNPNNSLRISYVGYKTIEVKVNGSEPLNIVLSQEGIGLDEVVVKGESKKIGGLNPVSSRDLTSSVQKIEMKDLEETKVSNIGEALQGRAGNVDITMASGDPGAGMSIRIRGTASISGSKEPLIVVDGVPFNIEIDDDFNFSGATQEQFSGLLNITPEDILSIEVLKDAASTAVWGSRGANGVILIDTKRGKKGKNTFEYLYKLSINEQPKSIPLLDGYSYSMLMLEEIFNSGSTEIPSEIEYNKESANYFNYSQNSNWLKAITKTGFTHDHTFSMMGGGESALYRFSVGYLDQTGTTVGTDYKRLTSRFNLDYNISSKLRISGDLSYTYGDNDLSYWQGEGYNTIRGVAYVKAPNMSIYKYSADGTISNQYFTPESNFQGQGYEWFNPLAMADLAVWNKKEHRLRTKMELKYNILRDLVFTSFVAYDMDNQIENQFLPYLATGSNWTSTNVNRASGMDVQSSSLESQSQLVYVYSKSSVHKLTTMLAFTMSDNKNGWYYGSTSNTPSPYIQDYTQSAPIYWLGDAYSQNRMIGFLGFIHYSLYDKFLFQLNARREGSSRLGYNSRWGTFPSLSFAYRLSSESFMKDIKFIDELKLRYSYGVNGNQPGSSYGYFNLYGTSGEYIDMPVVVPLNIQLDNFKWERNAQFNYGIDFQGFKSILDFHFDYYKQRSSDLIWDRLSLPGTSGFPEITRNWGTMENKGWESVLNSTLLRNNNFEITFSMNVARNRNIITEIPENFDFEAGNEARNGEYARRAEVGYPLGTFYGFKFLGVYPTDADALAHDINGKPINNLMGKPLYMRYGNADGYRFRGGDAIYADINHDGLINELDIVKIGDSNPDFFGGFGPKIKWKNLVVNLFFHYRLGYDIVNRTKMYNENMYSRNNQSVSVLNRWRRQGDITDMPRALYNQGYNWLGSDRFVEDGSFLRFKSASVSYSFKNVVKRLKLQEVKVNMMVYNLYTWTRYTGVDPEVPLLSNDPFFIGEDKSDTPPPKNFVLSINVRF